MVWMRIHLVWDNQQNNLHFHYVNCLLPQNDQSSRFVAGFDAFAGGTAGSTYSLEVANAAGATATHTYHFDTVGEYAVRTNGVRGPGCANTPAGTPSAANAIVEFFDVTTGATLNPCNDCTGPD